MHLVSISTVILYSLYLSHYFENTPYVSRRLSLSKEIDIWLERPKANAEVIIIRFSENCRGNDSQFVAEWPLTKNRGVMTVMREVFYRSTYKEMLN